MELLKPNYIDTITSIVVTSNTITSEYIMSIDPTFQYVSSGFNDDTTQASIRINFTQTMTVSRIALRGINLKELRLFYNGATANTFALTSTGATTSSYFTSNSETGLYLQCAAVDCTSVTLDMKKTMVANSEKAVGYFMVSQERLDFARIPAAKNYTPLVGAREVVHELSNGRKRIQSIAGNVHSFQVKLEYISESMRNSLRTIFDLHAGHIFVPFGTTTSWDQLIAPVVWPAPFNFYKFSDNAVGAGFEGSLDLMETDP